MAYETVNGLDAERVITIGGKDKKTGKANPTEAEGYYLGSRLTTGGKFGDSMLHVLQTPEGNLGVWGKTNLDKKISQVKPGTMVLILYKGMTATKNGDMHTYEVKHDKSNTIDVNTVNDTSSGGDDTYDESYSSDNSDAEEIEAYDPPPVRSPIAASAADRKARAEALLKRK